MKVITAVKQIQKESEFLGKDFAWVLEDMKKNLHVYPQKTREAFLVIENETNKGETK